MNGPSPIPKPIEEITEKTAFTPDGIFTYAASSPNLPENSFSFRGRSGYNSEVSERENSSRESSCSREESSRSEISKKDGKLTEGDISFNFDEKFIKFTHNKRAGMLISLVLI